MHEKEDVQNITYGCRPPRVVSDWFKAMKDQTGFAGTAFAQQLLTTARAACGDDVPEYPFELAVTVRCRTSRRFRTACFPATAETALAVGEAQEHYGVPKVPEATLPSLQRPGQTGTCP